MQSEFRYLQSAGMANRPNPVADLHYSVGAGECRDTDLEGCVGDSNTAAWLAEALDAENPDLVVREVF